MASPAHMHLLQRNILMSSRRIAPSGGEWKMRVDSPRRKRILLKAFSTNSEGGLISTARGKSISMGPDDPHFNSCGRGRGSEYLTLASPILNRIQNTLIKERNIFGANTNLSEYGF